jgi:hypothetical protein
MRKLPATLVGILAAFSAFAQFPAPPLIHDIEANSQQTQELIDLPLMQGASVNYRVRLKSRGKWLDLDGLTARVDFRETILSTNAYSASSSETVTNVTPNYFVIPMDYAQTGTAVTNWSYSVIALLATDEYPQGVGRVDIVANGFTGDPSTIITNIPCLKFVSTDSIDFAKIFGLDSSAFSCFGMGWLFHKA